MPGGRELSLLPVPPPQSKQTKPRQPRFICEGTGLPSEARSWGGRQAVCAVGVRWARLPGLGEGAWAAEGKEEVVVGGLGGGGDPRRGGGGGGCWLHAGTGLIYP